MALLALHGDGAPPRLWQRDHRAADVGGGADALSAPEASGEGDDGANGNEPNNPDPSPWSISQYEASDRSDLEEDYMTRIVFPTSGNGRDNTCDNGLAFSQYEGSEADLCVEDYIATLVWPPPSGAEDTKTPVPSTTPNRMPLLLKCTLGKTRAVSLT